MLLFKTKQQLRLLGHRDWTAGWMIMVSNFDTRKTFVSSPKRP